MVKGPEESDKRVYEETKFTMFVVKNNLPFSICDELSKTIGNMFPYGEQAKKYEAGKTKTSQTIKVKRRDNLKNPNCRPTVQAEKGRLKIY